MKNPKYYLLVITLCTCMAHIASAQVPYDVHVGISPAQKIGSQEIRVDNFNGECNGAISATNRSTGFTAGLGITYTMESRFFLRGEVQYSYSKTQYEMRDLIPFGEIPTPLHYEATNHTLTAPLSLGVRLGSFSLLSGINVNATIYSSSTLTNLNNFDDNSSPVYLGWHAGLGYDLGRFGLEVRYSQDFGNYAQGYSIGGKELTFYGNRLKWTVLAKYNFG